MIPPLMQYFKLDKGNVVSTLSPKDSQAAINTYGRAQTWDLHLCEIFLKWGKNIPTLGLSPSENLYYGLQTIAI